MHCCCDCDVLQDNESWFHLANNTADFIEEAASLALQSCALSGVTDVLAWETSDDAINVFGVWLWPGSDIVPTSNGWPMLCEDSLCIFVNLHLPFANHSCTLKTKIKTADSRKEGTKRQRHLNNGLLRICRHILFPRSRFSFRRFARDGASCLLWHLWHNAARFAGSQFSGESSTTWAIVNTMTIQW
jgi:hypothetical protein